MGRFVIAAFRPRPGQAAELLGVVSRHWDLLRSQGLVTSRPRQVMQAADGTVVEVFEWASPEAIGQAHHNAAVQALWAEFEQASEVVPLAALAESSRPFAEFTPLAL